LIGEVPKLRGERQVARVKSDQVIGMAQDAARLAPTRAPGSTAFSFTMSSNSISSKHHNHGLFSKASNFIP
jgi:hypothetical protein